MASVEQRFDQLAQQLAVLQTELQESRRREEDLNTRLAQVQQGAIAPTLQATMEQMVETQKAILDSARRDPKKVTLVDNRGLAKPHSYDGTADFLQWKIRLEAFVQSVHEDLEDPMTWAEEETDPISGASVAAAFGSVNPSQHEVPELEGKSQQLYAVLQTLCEKEAFTIIRAAGKGNGLEAWRRLCKRYDPSTGGRRRALLRSVLNPSRVNKIEELSAAVESWEEQVRQYENRRKPDGSRPTLDEDIRVAILESICPAEVERHLQLNQARFADYDEGRKELSSYLETRIGLKLKPGSSSNEQGPTPMDIGAFGGGGKGKGKGADRRAIKCHNCGKPGHIKSECWAPGGGQAGKSAKTNNNNTSKGTPSSKGGKDKKPKGKGDKGGKSGKGKGKGGKGRGGKGGKPKAVGNVEEQREPEGEEAAEWDGGDWEALGWDDGDWNEAAGSNESNYLALGALHVAAPMAKELKEEEAVEETEEEETAEEDEEVPVSEPTPSRTGERTRAALARGTQKKKEPERKKEGVDPAGGSLAVDPSVVEALRSMGILPSGAGSSQETEETGMARLLRVNLALGAIIEQQAAQLASLGSGASATSTPAPATPRAAPPKPPVTTKPALDMPMVADPKQPAPSRPKQKQMPRPKAPKAGPLFKHMPKSEVKVKAMPKVPKRELTRPSGDESSEDEPKAPATSSKGFALLPKEKWSSMRFSERIEHKKEMRKALPRGSIGDAALKAQGTDCDTCSERRTRGRSAARKKPLEEQSAGWKSEGKRRMRRKRRRTRRRRKETKRQRQGVVLRAVRLEALQRSRRRRGR